jgi:BRCT domain type II-containing protein
MNNKQLIKVIRTLVEVETAKQQERFLSKTFPRILEEEVSRRLAEVKGGVAVPSTQVVSEEIDPFQQVELALEQERATPKKTYSKNKSINEVLNMTTPFTKAQRSSGPVGGKSVLDTLPQQEPIQESMDKTVSFTSQGAGAGVEGMRTQMAQKMGYGDVSRGPSKNGLGVKTGLAGLDKILNRDNSALVKKFKK